MKFKPKRKQETTNVQANDPTSLTDNGSGTGPDRDGRGNDRDGNGNGRGNDRDGNGNGRGNGRGTGSRTRSGTEAHQTEAKTGDYIPASQVEASYPDPETSAASNAYAQTQTEAESVPRRRRRRKAQAENDLAVDQTVMVQLCADLLFMSHKMLASFLPWIELAPEEAKMLADPTAKVLSHFNLQPSPMVADVINLVSAAAMVYGLKWAMYQDYVAKMKASGMSPTQSAQVNADLDIAGIYQYPQ